MNKLADGSNSGKYRKGDTFIVTNYTGAHEVGEVITLKSIKFDTGIMYCSEGYQVLWSWLTPTLKTKAKYSKLWAFIDWLVG